MSSPVRGLLGANPSELTMTITDIMVKDFIFMWLGLPLSLFDDEFYRSKYKSLLSELNLIFKMEKEKTAKEVQKCRDFMSLFESNIRTQG